MSFSINGNAIKPAEGLIPKFQKEFRKEMDNTWGQSYLSKATIEILKAKAPSVRNSNLPCIHNDSHSELIFAKINEAQLSILKNSHHFKLNKDEMRTMGTINKLSQFIKKNKSAIKKLKPDDLKHTDFQTELLFQVALENLELQKLERSENPVFEAITDL